MGDKAPTSFNERLARAQGGDRSALGGLLQDHLSWLGRQARRAWPRRLDPKQSPSDLVQATGRVAIEKIARFTGGGEAGFRVWLRRILDNVRRQTLRDLTRERRDANVERELPDNRVAKASLHSPVNELVRSEDIGWLDRAMSYLDPEDRELLQLRFIDGLAYDGIAAQSGRSPAALRKRAQRAVERLRRGIPILRWMHGQGWQPVKIESVGLCYMRPCRPAESARALNIPQAAVEDWIRKLPESLRDPPGSENGHGTPLVSD
jgi:RNA polymerase sigma-70 factor (ECF subfamily)